MISVETALALIAANTEKLAPVILPLSESTGLVLAEDVFSPMDMPGFNQSAMDGYAIRLGDQDLKKTYLLTGKIPAGEFSNQPITVGDACRIFTGAPLPTGADTVIMQEQATRAGRLVQFDAKKPISTGLNVRLKGSEISKGELALKKGSLLNAGAIGFLASLGFTEIKVQPAPTIALLLTGNELKQPGEALGSAGVYESNSFTLSAALQSTPIKQISVQTVTDNFQLLKEALAEALNKADIVLVTGGVSVGDYDLVPQAMQACGVKTIFHKIEQKPGKPLFFGQWNNKPVFGLPGNPSSVLTCFYVYVLPAIQQLMERKKPFLSETKAIIKGNYSKAAGFTHFLKGKVEEGYASTLSAQESYRLSSFSIADCLIVIPPETTTITDGEPVKLIHLPH